MKKALVTGATGFIGSHLVDALIKENWQVDCYVKNDDSTSVLANKPVTITHKLENIHQYNIVYHIAGVLGKHGIPKQDYYEAHVDLTRNLLTKMNNRQHFYYMSTGWIKYPTKYYQITKIEGEKLVKQSNIPYNIIRPGFVYGARDYHHLPLFRLINKLGILFPIIGNGKNLISPTYIYDVIWYLLNPIDKEFYLSSNILTVEDFIIAIANSLSKQKPVIKIPYTKLIKKIPLLAEKLKVDFFTTEAVFDTQPHVTPLQTGLEATVKWYRGNKLL